MASVSYGIDNDKLMVWIDSAPALDPARAGSLCRRHADALSVPKGWSIDDRRQAVPMLFSAKDITPPGGQGRDTGERRQQSKSQRASKANLDPVVDASLFDENTDLPDENTADSTTASELSTVIIENVASSPEDHAVEETPEPEPELEETRAIPWTPRLTGTGGNDDTASITKGRLLGRAFGERPQRAAE